MQLLIAAFFGAAFALVEASVVIYLRAITGIASGSGFAELADLSSAFYQEARIVSSFPSTLLIVELLREGATMVMLVCVAFLTVRSMKERWATFLWTFGIWDICYYLSLRFAVGWPRSLKTPDILFLIPTPWISQVWFPLLVSIATLLAIICVRTRGRNDVSPRQLHKIPKELDERHQCRDSASCSDQLDDR